MNDYSKKKFAMQTISWQHRAYYCWTKAATVKVAVGGGGDVPPICIHKTPELKKQAAVIRFFLLFPTKGTISVIQIILMHNLYVTVTH